MVTIDRAVIARIDKEGKHFEILVDPELAYKFRHGSGKETGSVSIQKMMATNDIYSDSKKGTRVSEETLKQVFGTDDVLKIAEHILKHGDIQLTTEFKRKKIEERRREIASIISRNTLDPKTKLPHPIERVLNAMEQANVNITLESTDKQVKSVINAIKHILPLSTEKIKLEVHVPARYTGPAYGIIKNMANVEKESWLNNGDLLVVVTLSPGMKPAFYDKINHATGGELDIKEL